MFNKKTLSVYAVIIGVVFIISGVGKVIDTTGFSNLIYEYGLGYFMILSPLIVLIELLFGFYLIFLINPKRDSMISFFLLLIFTIAFLFGHFKNGVNDCGCFGSIQPSNIPFSFSIIRNIILMVMSFIVWFKYPKENLKINRWKNWFIMGFMSIFIFTAGFTFRTPLFLQTQPKTHQFQNQNIKNTELTNYVKTSKDSTYLIFCFSYSCPHCLNSIENLRQYQRTNTVDRVLVFATGTASDKLIFEQNFQPDFPIKDLSGLEMDKLTLAYPTAYYVKNDSIKVVIQGVLPSPFVFQKNNISRE